jgi:hypothetical protein
MFTLAIEGLLDVEAEQVARKHLPRLFGGAK